MKKIKYILIILVIVLLPTLIYIFDKVQAKYILTKNAKIGYTTSDYYFDVTLDKTEILSFPATINVTVKNNNGGNYTTEDLTYTIGVDNPNCTVTAVGGNTRTLAGGSKQQETYAVIIDRTKADDNEPINLKFTVNKPYNDSKSVNLSVYYGALVTNYDCPTTGIQWRIFHKDESGRIYLIADDYITREQIPPSRLGNKLNEGDSRYPNAAHFANIFQDYTGSEWIRSNTNENARKWLKKYLDAYPNSTNANIKAVAYMMDTAQWNSKFKGAKAEYVIGGPTLELFCASYKVTHPDRYIENSVAQNGYQLKWSDGSVYSNAVPGVTLDDFESIYLKSDASKAYGMWLACPGDEDSSFLVRTLGNGHLHGYALWQRFIWLSSSSLPKCWCTTNKQWERNI